eukprot:GHVS01039639.1.p1 GENE.GHVS01039639.1~~GHVS01039639.1.p1  ORF type:complete len:162 (+),score=10.58 GHVS01039639.1:183-668(+)
MTCVRHNKLQDFYLVSWTGYSEQDNSWVPRKNIIKPDAETLEKMKHLKSRYIPPPIPNADSQKKRSHKRAKTLPSNSMKETVIEASAPKDIDEDVEVLHLKNSGAGMIYVHAVGRTFPPANHRYFVPLEEFRHVHPQPLIDYVCQRLSFGRETSTTASKNH